MTRPKAVLISDVHYSFSTYQVADRAFRAAIDTAADLKVPLIDAGDITNDKALMRAEVCNALIASMEYAQLKGVEIVCLVGNHSLINEKGKEHALQFLKPWCDVIDKPDKLYGMGFIPYQSNPAKFYEAMRSFSPGSIVIGHQGTKGGAMGDYIQDRSAIEPEKVSEYKVFLGHYHQHYILETTVSIGNPYTLTFGEAKDGPKGFLVLYDDGTFSREILHLRKHIKLEYTVSQLNAVISQADCAVRPGDLLWLKVTGTRTELDKVKKEDLSRAFCTKDFKLDKVCTATETLIRKNDQDTSPTKLFDDIIQAAVVENADYLKKLWRDICE